MFSFDYLTKLIINKSGSSFEDKRMLAEGHIRMTKRKQKITVVYPTIVCQRFIATNNTLINLDFFLTTIYEFFELVVPNKFGTSITALLVSPTFSQKYLILPSSANSLATQSSKLSLNYSVKIWFVFFSYLEDFDDASSNILLKTDPKLAENYAIIHQQLFEEYNIKIMNKITQRSGFLSWQKADDLEFPEIIHYERIRGFDEAVTRLYEWWKFFVDLFLIGSIYDMTVSYYWEPFYFFWENIQQSVEDYWFICFFRERGLLFDDRIFEFKAKWNDPKHLFPPLSHLEHPNNSRYSWKILRWLYDHKQSQAFSYYLDYFDIQTYAIDRNFVHLWDYNSRLWRSQNIFGPSGWTGFINYYWEKLYSPRVHFPSLFYWYDYGYGSYSTWMLEFAFFPDSAALQGHFNPIFDWLAFGYSRFFHFGDTHFDSLISLMFAWFNITANYWGDFDLLTDDYSAYQPAYFADNIATIWLPMQILLMKKYKGPKHMNIFIDDFDQIFFLKKIKKFKNLTGEYCTPHGRLKWFSFFWDPQPIDYWMHTTERLLMLFFGYNTSAVLANQPHWLPNLTNHNIFYGSVRYDHREDIKLEEWSKKLVFSLSHYDYKYGYAPSIYFSEYWAENVFWVLSTFLNEKIFDNSGFFLTSLHRTEPPWSINRFEWLQLSIFHMEYLPQDHYTWNIKIFNLGLEEWRGHISPLLDGAWVILKWASKMVFFTGAIDKPGISLTWTWKFFLFHIIPNWCSLLFFQIDPFQVLTVLKWFWGPSVFDKYWFNFFDFINNLYGTLPPILKLIELEDLYKGGSLALAKLTSELKIIDIYEATTVGVKIEGFYEREIPLKFLIDYLRDNLPKIYEATTVGVKIEGFYEREIPLKFLLNFFLLNLWDISLVVLFEYFGILGGPWLETRLVPIHHTTGYWGGAALHSYSTKIWLLPLVFFLPGVRDWQSCVILDQTSFSPIELFYNNFAGVAGTPKTLEDLEHLMSLLAIASVIWFGETHHLPKIYLDAINSMDMSIYKNQRLEYDWYLNYVYKRSCYWRN